jgi:hypothetical protein
VTVYRYTLVCSVCGKSRPSEKSPTNSTAAKMCRSCHMDGQRVYLEALMGKKGMRDAHIIRLAHKRFRASRTSAS